MWPFYSTMRNITFHKNVYVETLSTTSPVKLLKFKPSIITATLAHPKWTIPFFGANKDSQTYITKPFIKKMKYNIKIYISEKKWIFSIKNYVQKNYAKFATSKFTWKKLPKLQHPDLHGQKKTLTLQYPNLREPKNLPNLQHQTLREQKNAKFTTPKFTCCCCSSAPVPFLLLWMATCAFWMERNVNVSLKRLNKAMNVLSLKQYSPNNYLCATWWWQLASMAMRLSLQCGPSKTDLETLKSNLSLK